MRGEAVDREQEAERYAKKLPISIDLLLLSVGPDGHIASLFPESSVLEEMDKSVVLIVGPKTPSERLTVTPMVLKAANTVLLFVNGIEKGEVVARALDSDDPFQFPVPLVKDRTWLLDGRAVTAMESEQSA